MAKKDDIYLENVKVLVDLMKHDGKLYWDKFNVWLVLISALLVVTPYAQQFDLFGLKSSGFVIPVLGLITSLVWLSTSSRSMRTYNHYIRLEREIEEKYLQNFMVFRREDDLKKTYRFYEKVPILKMSLIIPLAFLVLFSLIIISQAYLLIFPLPTNS
jgi:hypothetical protein